MNLNMSDKLLFDLTETGKKCYFFLPSELVSYDHIHIIW